MNYYTPTIEEFHIGFEYEKDFSSNQNESEWRKRTFTDIDDIATTMFLADVGKVRVKFLDREDIESLGWKLIAEGKYELNGYYLFNDYMPNKYSFFEGDESDCLYRDDNFMVAFHLTIRNKSELSRIMKQIGIV